MNITDKIMELEAAKREVTKKCKELQAIIQAELGEQFIVCDSSSPDYTQLYLNRELCSNAEAIEILKGVADNGEVRVKSDDSEYIHYDFWIDRSKFIILLDKED